MSIGPAAVTAARPGLEASASLVVDRAVHEAMWSLDYGLHDKCDNFGARKSRQKPYCECLGATVPSKQCDADEDGRFMGFLIEPEDGCSCLAAAGVSRERSVFVRASALKFCSAILDKTAEARGKLEELVATKANSYLDKYGRRVTRLRMNELKPEEVHFVKVANNLRDYVRKELGVTQKLCREVLTGSSREDQEWYSGATELAEHEDAKGFGHLDPLVTGSVESHRVLLQKVCKDECEGIVDETINNINKMVQWDVGKKTMPFEQSCADRVVRKVESEILGCCGRACGWNNRSCMAWPFFTKDQKVGSIRPYRITTFNIQINILSEYLMGNCSQSILHDNLISDLHCWGKLHTCSMYP